MRLSPEIYGKLKPGITFVEQSQADLDTLIGAARKIINEKFVPDPLHWYLYMQKRFWSNIRGSRCRRGCHARMWTRVGRRKWKTRRRVCHPGLWSERRPWRHGRGTCGPWHYLVNSSSILYTSGRQPYEAHRQVATLETTTPHVWGWSGRRRVLCQEDMIFGDEYECILTGIQVWTHPALDDDGFRVELRACHILYRFIGTSEQEQRSDSLKSAQTTFDLLVEFLCLPARYIEQA
ncbi:uncharacterized protein LACBIDRAFT_318263 [Laccaria bicolor S238N-H82]|uniref:Predicted protein n=1 Tax=Laccaria bicolor (strain S238N-H82 / ATCC MYA-4686) TaxID=486041 RepID=B0D6B5_LACBS|nr:uncharacterized protein LACBIDRAFT_318263 [Laccaria bicolor S238N-H82]EDR10165.1 predicted protein [Laccaria bicolor S238N-H82]|eukprot:XP_001879550.1 predicted protein [Laccaria bicolor S238N-H82]